MSMKISDAELATWDRFACVIASAHMEACLFDLLQKVTDGDLSQERLNELTDLLLPAVVETAAKIADGLIAERRKRHKKGAP